MLNPTHTCTHTLSHRTPGACNPKVPPFRLRTPEKTRKGKTCLELRRRNEWKNSSHCLGSCHLKHSRALRSKWDRYLVFNALPGSSYSTLRASRCCFTKQPIRGQEGGGGDRIVLQLANIPGSDHCTHPPPPLTTNTPTEFSFKWNTLKDNKKKEKWEQLQSFMLSRIKKRFERQQISFTYPAFLRKE